MMKRATCLLIVLATLFPVFHLFFPATAPVGAERLAEDDDQALLETVGTLSAGHLYQTYLNIGFLANGVSEEVYEPEQAQRLLDSVLSLTETLDRQLARVDALRIAPADRRVIADLRKVSQSLRTQGKHLQDFWDADDADDADRSRQAYEKSRQESWKGIAAKLQFKP
ncbi:MAG: hypothetical protein N2C14_21725 [Planctomycetales bacterium]